MEQNISASAFSGLIDLASERNGGKALMASDEFFAPKENLLKEGRGTFIADKFTESGKWMDGWESRRKRVTGYDWCVIKLGVRGTIKGLDIDTNHFLGNHPPYASVDACYIEEGPDTEEYLSDRINWTELLSLSSLNPGSQNFFSVLNSAKWTHVRLNIFPDGGVARFRVYGEVDIELIHSNSHELIDLAALLNGGRVIVCNDMFFGSKDNLISPGRSKNMGDGWETKRKRIPGHDWTILKLAAPGEIKRIIVDTHFFKGNFPDSCSIEACYMPEIGDDSISKHDIKWKELLPQTKLKGDFENTFENEIKKTGTVSHVKLNIFPDGGISRLRLYGTVIEKRLD